MEVLNASRFLSMSQSDGNLVILDIYNKCKIAQRSKIWHWALGIGILAKHSRYQIQEYLKYMFKFWS